MHILYVHCIQSIFRWHCWKWFILLQHVTIMWSVHMLSITLMHPAKTVGWNEMPFGRDTRVVPSNSNTVLNRGFSPPTVRGDLGVRTPQVCSNATYCQNTLAFVYVWVYYRCYYRTAVFNRFTYILCTTFVVSCLWQNKQHMSQNWPFNRAKMLGTSCNNKPYNSCLRAAIMSSRGHANSSDAMCSSTSPSSIVSSRRISCKKNRRFFTQQTADNRQFYATVKSLWCL